MVWNEDKDLKVVGVMIDCKYKLFGFIVWDILDDDKNEIVIFYLVMVIVFFKWEKIFGKVYLWNFLILIELYVNEIKVKDSSVVFSFGRDCGFYGGIEKGFEKVRNKLLNEEVGVFDVNFVVLVMNVLELLILFLKFIF